MTITTHSISRRFSVVFRGLWHFLKGCQWHLEATGTFLIELEAFDNLKQFLVSERHL